MSACTVRVICDTGNHWTTRINLTFAEACDYFMGKRFVREDHDGREIADTVIRVEELTEKAEA